MQQKNILWNKFLVTATVIIYTVYINGERILLYVLINL